VCVCVCEKLGFFGVHGAAYNKARLKVVKKSAVNSSYITVSGQAGLCSSTVADSWAYVLSLAGIAGSSVVCCVLPGRGLCVRLITRTEECYRMPRCNGED
jgi:hypothetical protein